MTPFQALQEIVESMRKDAVRMNQEKMPTSACCLILEMYARELETALKITQATLTPPTVGVTPVGHAKIQKRIAEKKQLKEEEHKTQAQERHGSRMVELCGIPGDNEDDGMPTMTEIAGDVPLGAFVPFGGLVFQLRMGGEGAPGTVALYYHEEQTNRYQAKIRPL